MTLNQYQKRARIYMQGNVKNDALYLALGLGGEVGEVLEKIKRKLGTVSLKRRHSKKN